MGAADQVAGPLVVVDAGGLVVIFEGNPSLLDNRIRRRNGGKQGSRVRVDGVIENLVRGPGLEQMA